MTKHLSARFAWHDNKWNGKICKKPEENIYCVGNYSLLSARLQRRRDLEIEKKYSGQPISKVIEREGYVPPCYWCINALGEDECEVQDPHPFEDYRGEKGRRFRKRVPPIKMELPPKSIFTWNFKIGYARGIPQERYRDPELQEKYTQEYLDEIQGGKSIVFFYANYSNPITGDSFKSLGERPRYVLLGAGLVNDTKEPHEYEIPDEMLSDIRSEKGKGNFPEMDWQFRVTLQPDSTFVMPYQEYLSWIKKEDEIDKDKKWKQLSEVAIPIEEKAIIPNFKYVSMHLSHDKAIYLLYRMKNSLEKMRDHQIVKTQRINHIEEKVDHLLEIAWEERGEYPGFRNVLQVLLKDDFRNPKDITSKIADYLIKNFGSIAGFLNGKKPHKEDKKAPPKIRRPLKIVKNRKNRIKFYSQFNFSIKQFKNIINELEGKVGFNTIKKNPYLLLEKYYFEQEDSWNIDYSDYGLSLFQIDIALIPDKIAKWQKERPLLAKSPERLRAVIAKILHDAARIEGHSCLEREKIIERIADYPLYYIPDQLSVSASTLEKYEEGPLFKQKFLIKNNIVEDKTLYQLKELRNVEEIIENFINQMLEKSHSVNEASIKSIIEEDKEDFEKKLKVEGKRKRQLIKERKQLYHGAQRNGFYVLSGKAGSGKTTAVVNLIRQFEDTDDKLPIFVFTPTGKANLVIKNKLREKNLHKHKHIRVSTIHRFLYGAPFEGFDYRTRKEKSKAFELVDLISKVLDKGKWELLEELKELTPGWKFQPKVLIIDETSMVDEVLLATLFLLVNEDTLEHLIFVGDEKQLPPIGVGRPLVDAIYHLKKEEQEENLIHLESNLRFDPTARLGRLSELFSSEDQPSPTEIKNVLDKSDSSLETQYFADRGELKEITKKVLQECGSKNTNKPIFDMFTEVFKEKDEIKLNTLQLLSPRRVGRFGTWALNRRIVLNDEVEYRPNTKLICEENIYFKSDNEKVLGIANGSIGYIKNRNDIRFDEISELFGEYPFDDVMKLVRKLRNDIYNPLKSEKILDFGYGITVHKAQGSGFDHVLFVLSEMSPFITKELLYTAFTRAKDKLHFVIHDNLEKNLSLALSNVYKNSAVGRRNTLLFEFKKSPFRPYEITLQDGETIEVKSKIEYIITSVLDQLDVDFTYEPKDFVQEHHIKPDFKININGETFYLEHLGLMEHRRYRERWFDKFEIYKEIGVVDHLITTSEREEKENVEQKIKKIVKDIRSQKLKDTKGEHSKHHYFL